jgi:hypothetical protein
MISDHYNKTVSTKRLEAITSTKKEQYATYLTGIKCLIQPFTQSFGEDIDGSVGKDFNMYCQVSDIKQGDEIVDGSNVYKVVGNSTYEDGVGSHHMELVIREYKE